jgi:tetratricopeptide (TPR) repeat protein
MNKLLNAVFITALVFSACSKTPVVELPITTTSPKALEFYKKATDYFETTDFQEGLTALDSALALDPNFALASLNRWHPDPDIRTKNRKKAYSLMNEVSSAEKYILKSNQFGDAGNADSALYNIQKLVEENPESYEAYNRLGLVCGGRKEMLLSEKAYKKAIELNPDNYEAYTRLCGQHIMYGFYDILPEEKRDIKKGREYTEKLMELKPNSAHGYHFKANSFRQTAEFKKAIPLYDRAIELSKGTDSEASETYVSAHNLMFAGDFNKARERYKKAVKIAQDKKDFATEGDIMNYITLSYLFQKDFEGALDNLYAMMENLESNKNLSEAEYLDRSTEAERRKFLCYAHNQMEKEAKKALLKTIELNEKLAVLMQDETRLKGHQRRKAYLTSWNDILFGNYQSARKNLETLKEIAGTFQNPTAFNGYYRLMGMLYLMEGAPTKAEELFNQGGWNTYFDYFKALALKANGKKEEAKEILSNIAGDNFSYLELALVKVLAQEQLQKL